MISNKDHVSLRGTRNGILVSISENCPMPEGLEQLKATLHQRRAFFAGSPLSLDLGWREVTEQDADLVIVSMREMGMRLLGVISTSQITRHIFEARGLKVIIGTLGLARHGARTRQGKPPLEPSAPVAATSPAPPAKAAPTHRPPAGPVGTVADEDESEEVAPSSGADPRSSSPPPTAPPTAPPSAQAAPASRALPTPGADTMLIRRTLRSGQRVQFPGNIVIMGDVNAGAEVEAEGDVIVLGNLRGTAHAGAGVSGKKEAVVVALNFHATQVRIGDLIGFVQATKGFHQNAAVMARIQDGAVATCLYGNGS